MRKNLLAILFLLPAMANLMATDPNPIYTAVPSLTIAPDARAGGMGDVGAATTPDVNSQYWNPSKYVFMDSEVGISLSYTPWLRALVDDIDLINLAGYYKFNQRQALSASVRYFSLGKVTLFQDEYEAINGSGTNIQPLEMAVDVAYSQLLSEKFSLSAGLRFIYSDLNNGASTGMYPGVAIAADVSAFYRTPISLSTGKGQLSLGGNISNIGSKITYDKGATNHFIPTNLRLGASFDYDIDDFQRISLSADINKFLVPTPDTAKINKDLNYYNNMSPIAGIFSSFGDAPGGFKEELQEIMWSVGVEYAYNKQFFVRAGYFNENQYKGNRKYFTAGAGFKLNVFQLDAGYVISTSQSNPLDQTLRFSLSFDLFGLKNLVK